MNRRDFLAASAAVAAAGAVPAASPGASALRPRARLRKALKFGMINAGASLEEKFRIAKDAGFDGVEMDSPNDLRTEDVLDAKAKTGLEIPGVVDSIHWNKTLSHPDAAVRAEGVKGLEQALRDCRAYGGTSVLLVPAVVNKQVSYRDAYRRSQEEIRRVLPLAQELGVRIAFENVWNHFLLSPLEAVRYVDEFASPLVGFHFDVGNIVNYGWPEHWIEALGHRIFKLDIKEFSRKKRDGEGLWKGFAVEIGEGDCDWAAVMKALAAIGYEGWAAAEVGGGGPERLKEIATRMDRVFAL